MRSLHRFSQLSIASLFLLFATNSSATTTWSYEGHLDPHNWKNSYLDCGSEKEQSPINLALPIKNPNSTKLQLSVDKTQPTFIENNGHTIQLNYTKNKKVTLSTDQQTFHLVQIHFHSPSENTINGKHFPLEAHFVYEKKKLDGKKELAVLAVFFKEGEANPGLTPIWENIPETNQSKKLSATRISLTSLWPNQKTFYAFSGSLTTPPCTGNIRWFVFSHPVSTSKEQVEIFQQYYNNNNRPLQPLNHRSIETGTATLSTSGYIPDSRQ